jgi:hypothetical protein
MSRRAFLVSACGAASTLLAMNAAYASRGQRGGFFDIAPEAALDLPVARSTLDRSDFIFDVPGTLRESTGCLDPSAAAGARSRVGVHRIEGLCGGDATRPRLSAILGADEFHQGYLSRFATSDLIVLSVRTLDARNGEPLTIEEAAATAASSKKCRVRIESTCMAASTEPGRRRRRDGHGLPKNIVIAAWKTYTQWDLTARAFFLDDEQGLKLIEKARKLGIRNIAVHKGLPFGPQSYAHSTCSVDWPCGQTLSRRQLSHLSLGLRHNNRKGPTMRSAMTASTR